MQSGLDLSFIEMSQGSQAIHFSHANGYPPQTYEKFLQPFLNSHRVTASLHRPLWHTKPDPESLKSWRTLGDDLLEVVSSQPGPVLAIGHSMGASANVLAAVQRPELFEGVVMIEPVLVPQSYHLMLKLFSGLIRNRLPLIQRTLNRVDSWDSREKAFSHFRPKPVFKRIQDEVLMDYVNHGTFVDEDGRLRLLFSKEWEAQCYLTVHNIWQSLTALDVPVLIVRGERSSIFTEQAFKRLQTRAPQFSYKTIEASAHLVPFEQPLILASVIQQWQQSL